MPCDLKDFAKDTAMPAPSFETLLYSVDDGIATITLNRPDRLNAFTTAMMADMIAALDDTDADDAVGAVIVTGAGRGFCAGADLSAGAATFDRDARPDPVRREGRVGGVERDGGGRLTLRIFDSLKPVIAAVNGPAVGVGVTMQLAMDIRLASTSARFGFVFARRGITPEAASSWFLPRLVGLQTAWSGATPAGCSPRKKPSTKAWSAPCMSRAICCPRPAPWPGRSSTTRPRCPLPSPVRCCGAWPAPITPWRLTAPTAGPFSPEAPPATPAKG